LSAGMGRARQTGMATMISSGIDVVTFLEEQHDQIKAAFEQIQTSTGEHRKNLFVALRRLLAVHETAEEEIVHPAARRALPNGDVIVDARLREENEAKKVLAALEDLDVDSAEFEQNLALLRSSVLAHARAEEENEFERLADVLDTDRLEKMRKAVNFAESVAPTRPHPGVESRAANMLAGPFAMMLDRARDAISGKN
jgi:hemerythrin superfamily protein